jgi:hypothetical protein
MLRIVTEDAGTLQLLAGSGRTVQSDIDEFLTPAFCAFKQQLVMAGHLGLDHRKPHPSFARRTDSVEQRIDPPQTQLGVLHLTLPSTPIPPWLSIA